MSKIDEMRRRREAQYAQQQQQRESQRREKPSKREAPPVERPTNLVAVPKIADVEVAPVPPANDAAKAEGKCSVCGKTKALQNGLLTSHQKGLGKRCAGSRTPPLP